MFRTLTRVNLPNLAEELFDVLVGGPIPQSLAFDEADREVLFLYGQYVFAFRGSIKMNAVRQHA